MLYYQVKPQFDNYRKPGKTFDIYVARELYTPKEVERYHLNKDYLQPVEISKRKTYFFFGARFGGVTQ